ncbi:MAG: hypothetical protein ACM3ZB_05270 [bacterium]|jgi:hypothetical protein
MAKIRPARAGRQRQSKVRSWAKGVPCLVVVLGLFVILTLLLTSILSTGVR